MADPRTQATPREQVAVPADLQSPRSKLLYVALTATGGARPLELRSALGMSSLSLYPIIRDLREAGIVERAENGAVQLVDTDAAEFDAR